MCTPQIYRSRPDAVNRKHIMVQFSYRTLLLRIYNYFSGYLHLWNYHIKFKIIFDFCISVWPFKRRTADRNTCIFDLTYVLKQSEVQQPIIWIKCSSSPAAAAMEAAPMRSCGRCISSSPYPFCPVKITVEKKVCLSTGMLVTGSRRTGGQRPSTRLPNTT